jgi:hypothetical protein
MTALLRLLLLPFQAPMLLLLLLVSTYLGLHWGQPIERAGVPISPLGSLIWSVECVQALAVVMVCCMPDLLLRRFSSLLATSRVVTLVATLLLVTVGGLYLLHLELLSNVLILASAVLLARLDLARMRIAPSPPLLAALLGLLVLAGASLGHWFSLANPEAAEPQVRPPAQAPRARVAPRTERRAPLFGRVGPAKPPPVRP